MANSVRTKYVRGIAWNFVEKMLVQGSSFIISIVLARLLSPSDFGLVGMLSIFVAISDVFIHAGFAKALIQKKDKTDIDYSTAFVTNVSTALIIYVIMFFSAPLIARYYHEPILIEITRVLSINFILGSFNIVQRSRLMSSVNFKALARVNIISVIVGGIIGIVLAYSGFGVWSLVIKTLCTSLVLMIMFPLSSKWKPSIKFSKNSFKQLFGFGSKLMITGIYSVIFRNISTIFIGRYYKSSQLGYYTRASQFSETIAHTVYNVLGTVSFPVLSSLQDDRKHMVSVYKKSLYYTSLIVFPIMILCTLLAKPIILVLLTEKWLPCVALMQWLFLARMFTPVSALNMNILNAIGRSDLFMKLDFAKAPLTIIALIITVPIGVEAICIGNFITTFISFFINAYLPGKLFGYGAWQQIKDWRKIILSVLLMSGLVLLFNYFINNIWLQLFVGGIIGLGSYIGCCFMFGLIDQDIINMVKSKLHKKK